MANWLSFLAAVVFGALTVPPQFPVALREAFLSVAALALLTLISRGVDRFLVWLKARPPTLPVLEKHPRRVKAVAVGVPAVLMLASAPSVHSMFVPAPAVYVRCLNGAGTSFPPVGPLHVFHITDSGTGMVIFTGVFPAFPIAGVGPSHRCAVINDGQTPLRNVSIVARLRVYRAITTSDTGSSRMGDFMLSRDAAISAARIDPGPAAAFEFFTANSRVVNT